MKSRTVFLVSCTAFWVMQAGDALAANCGTDFQHAYEKGVRDGRGDGSHLREYDPMHHGRKVARKWNERLIHFHKQSFTALSSTVKRKSRILSYQYKIIIAHLGNTVYACLNFTKVQAGDASTA